jgi:hypothetical protein
METMKTKTLLSEAEYAKNTLLNVIKNKKEHIEANSINKKLLLKMVNAINADQSFIMIEDSSHFDKNLTSLKTATLHLNYGKIKFDENDVYRLSNSILSLFANCAYIEWLDKTEKACPVKWNFEARFIPSTQITIKSK